MIFRSIAKWYRAAFGTQRSGVRIPLLRPKTVKRRDPNEPIYILTDEGHLYCAGVVLEFVQKNGIEAGRHMAEVTGWEEGAYDLWLEENGHELTGELKKGTHYKGPFR